MSGVVESSSPQLSLIFSQLKAEVRSKNSKEEIFILPLGDTTRAQYPQCAGKKEQRNLFRVGFLSTSCKSIIHSVLDPAGF